MVGTTSLFYFDCPSCLRRLATDVAGRGVVRRCPGCAAEFPSPEFHAAGELPARTRTRDYPIHCPDCGTRRGVQEADAGSAVTCSACGRHFRQPLPGWDRWRRPVARVLPCDDLRTVSIAARGSRACVQRERVPAGRRVFEYYCGACGVLQQTSVWHIALPVRCEVCAARLIVPPPRHPRRHARGPLPTAAAAVAAATCGLYCPQCGQHLPDADHSRRAAAHCRRCALWF